MPNATATPAPTPTPAPIAVEFDSLPVGVEVAAESLLLKLGEADDEEPEKAVKERDDERDERVLVVEDSVLVRTNEVGVVTGATDVVEAARAVELEVVDDELLSAASVVPISEKEQ